MAPNLTESSPHEFAIFPYIWSKLRKVNYPMTEINEKLYKRHNHWIVCTRSLRKTKLSQIVDFVPPVFLEMVLFDFFEQLPKSLSKIVFMYHDTYNSKHGDLYFLQRVLRNDFTVINLCLSKQTKSSWIQSTQNFDHIAKEEKMRVLFQLTVSWILSEPNVQPTLSIANRLRGPGEAVAHPLPERVSWIK